MHTFITHRIISASVVWPVLLETMTGSTWKPRLLKNDPHLEGNVMATGQTGMHISHCTSMASQMLSEQKKSILIHAFRCIRYIMLARVFIDKLELGWWCSWNYAGTLDSKGLFPVPNLSSVSLGVQLYFLLN